MIVFYTADMTIEDDLQVFSKVILLSMYKNKQFRFLNSFLQTIIKINLVKNFLHHVEKRFQI